MQYFIYGLVDPITKHLRYVGLSTTGLKRPRSHISPSRLRKDKTHKANWIRQLVKVGLQYEIVIIQSFLEADLLGEAEVFWISYFRNMGYPLTNVAPGGKGLIGKEPWNKGQTKETDLRLLQVSCTAKANYASGVNSRKRAKMSEENKSRVKRLFSKPKTEEHKKKLSRANLGHINSAESIERVAVQLRGRKQSLLACPHCDKVGGTTMHRWHFENCKERQ
jgi:hypothetical protein